MTAWETTAAWRELLDGLASIDQMFLDGPRAVHDERSVAEGYRMAAIGLGVALDTYLFGDPARPIFLDANTPFRRDRPRGGDHTDAWYAFTPVDPQRTYRVSGNRGDSAYFSLTVYNEPSPGAWSTRIVGIVNDSDLAIAADGSFSFFMGPARPDGYDGPFVELANDAHVAFTRDYQLDPLHGRRVEWRIDTLEPAGAITRTDQETAVALRASLQWL